MTNSSRPLSLWSTALPVLGFLASTAATAALVLISPLDWLPSRWMNLALAGGALIAMAWLAGISARTVSVTTLAQLAGRTRTTIDDRIVDSEVIPRLARAVPWILIYFGVQAVFAVQLNDVGDLVIQSRAALGVEIVRRIALAFVIISLTLAVPSLLSTVNNIYSDSYGDARRHPIKGYLQVVAIIAYGAAALAVVAVLAGIEPGALFAGLGALTAILLLVFRDTILSLVASVQLVSNDMIRIGDWVSMPQANTDGDVIDVALHTVKVQNWDKTISTIPTSKFITESFKNWRGMSESGGRRIKRSLNIDMNSVHFLEGEEIARLSRYEFIRDYMRRKLEEIGQYNTGKGLTADGLVDGGPDGELIPERRRLTNIGTFRAYMEHYLRHHPSVHKEMTLLTRQLPSGPQGIPIEIYCFSNDTAWAVYEGLQADIFDHLIAMLPEFGLRVFQKPSGQELVQAVRG